MAKAGLETYLAGSNFCHHTWNSQPEPTRDLVVRLPFLLLNHSIVIFKYKKEPLAGTVPARGSLNESF